MKFQHKIVSILMLLLSFSLAVNAQEQLNDYKYIVISEQFSCQKKANDYQLNGLTKFLLEKQNFVVFLGSEDLPEDAINNGCLVVYADVTEDSGMFKTKLRINFKNCSNQIVFTSEEGESRSKEYKVAYNVAMRNTIKTFQTFKHDYIAKPVSQETVSQETVVKEEGIKDAEIIPVVTRQKTTINPRNKIDDSQVSKNNSFKAELIQGSVFSYNLKNENNFIVYTILFSGKEDVYLIKGTEALIYKMNNQWVLAEYKNDILQAKGIAIQF